VTSNYWESVYSEVPLANLERRDGSVVFEWLHRHLPVGQLKIDWTNVQGRHANWKVEDDDQLGVMALREVSKRMKPGSMVEHVGDGLSPFGVRFGGVDASAIVGALLEIPEHHYFLADDRSWLVVVTSEGDLDVLDRQSGETS